MSYTKPTLEELINAVKADLFGRFPDLDPNLANSFAANVAEVIAGGTNGLYGYIEWVSKQQFPDTADADGLDRLASNYGLSRLAATKADGTMTFTGSIGSSVATGDELVSASGIKYTIDTGFTLSATSEDHDVTAVISGEDGNLSASSTVSFVSVPIGMDSTVTVDSGGITGGTDRESDDELRVRILTTLSSPPKGGKIEDYELWATEATDVTRSWPVAVKNQADYNDTVPDGEVWQYFVMDDTYQTDATYGIPQSGDKDDLEDYIKPLVPITAVYTAKILTAETIDFNLTILPDTPTNQTATETELRSAILQNRLPGGTIKLSSFYEAMSRVAGLTSWSINSINSLTPADVTASTGAINTIGTFTFV